MDFNSLLLIRLCQVKRQATKNLRLGDDQESLKVKVEFTQVEATCARLWRKRMMELLAQGMPKVVMI